MPQFGERHRRGAALADHDGGRGIGGAHGGLERRLHRQQHRHHRDDGIAGAGDVAHLDRISRNVDRRVTVEMQRHALLAAGDQHRLAFDELRQLGRGVGDLGFRRHRTMHGGAELLTVRRDQGGAAIDAVIVAFRIDHDRLAVPARRIDHGPDDARRQHAFGVIGQDHGADLRHRGFGVGDDRRLALGAGRRRGLPIGAHQMGRMMLGDEAHLARGLPRLIDDEIGHDRGR